MTKFHFFSLVLAGLIIAACGGSQPATETPEPEVSDEAETEEDSQDEQETETAAPEPDPPKEDPPEYKNGGTKVADI